MSKDLQGKIAVVTGANSGIGLEACVQLALRGCTVVMCCRNEKKAEVGRQDVVKRGQSEAVFVVQLDLADLDNVASFRSRYDANAAIAGKPVDMLILNAGIMALNSRELSKQGIEAQMATNVVGHFKFTAVMLDLCKSAPHSRIVWVSSGAHTMTKRITFDDFNRDKKYSKWMVYAETKLGNLLMMAKMNRVFEEKGLSNVVAVGCHPGYSNTNLQEHTIFKYINYILAQPQSMGATPTVLAATDPKAVRNGYAGPTGIFEMRGAAGWKRGVNKAVWNQKLQDGLWDKCEELTGAGFITRL